MSFVKFDHPDTVFSAVQKWLVFRRDHGMAIEPDRFHIEADHSLRGGLLGRFLAGRDPLPHPPPICMSRPWYGLIEAGPEGVRGEMSVWWDHPFARALGGVNMDGEVWKLLGESRWESEHTLEITWEDRDGERNWGTWLLTRTQENPSESEWAQHEWWLRPA